MSKKLVRKERGADRVVHDLSVCVCVCVCIKNIYILNYYDQNLRKIIDNPHHDEIIIRKFKKLYKNVRLKRLKKKQIKIWILKITKKKILVHFKYLIKSLLTM